jgi:tRNA(Ile)-lysidine synthase
VVPLSPEEFGALMRPLGPFEPAPRIAVAVSGGADSLALALLADCWARDRGGSARALIVDHCLRPDSAAEAALTVRTLNQRHIASAILPLSGLRQGSGLAERARAARFGALAPACEEAGIVHLLLGHHAADQAETVLIRGLGGSGSAGLAGMAALRETETLRLLRPLLAIPPGRLRATLEAAGVDWAEDPSNADQRALRPRLRAWRGDRDGVGAATAALLAASAADGVRRAATERERAVFLASGVVLRPEGFAVLPPGQVPVGVIAALVQTISGRPFPPSSDAAALLGDGARFATLNGTRLLPAGRFGRGSLLIREESAMAPAIVARSGATWDGRFRVTAFACPPIREPKAEPIARRTGNTIGEPIGDLTVASVGALGADAAELRHVSCLPAAILRTLPAIRCGMTLFAVPHLSYPDAITCAGISVIFAPSRPAACAPFLPSQLQACRA